MSWKQFREQWEKDWNDPSKEKVYRSRSYEKFYEDYEEQAVERRGRPELKREYIGDYYRMDCTDRERSAGRAASLISYAAALGLYVVCALRRTVYNAAAAACVTQALVLVSLLWFLIPLYFRLTAPREMMIRVYRKAGALFRRLALFSAVCFWILTGTVLVLLALTGTEPVSGLLLAAGYGVCGGLMYLNYRLEKRTVYERVPGIRSRRFRDQERAAAR